MANYTKTTNFTAKDALTTGDPNKLVKGSEHDTEYDAIETSSTTKANKIVSGVNNNVIKQSAGGDLVDSGYSFSGLVGDTAVTKAELDTLDGITSTTAELNILDGVTATAAEINILDGVTSTAAELNILDGVTATAAEINYIDGVTSNLQVQIDAIQSAAGGASLVLLATGTASASASLEFTGIDSTYSKYRFELSGIVPATDNTILNMQYSTDNGSTYITTNYKYSTVGLNSNNVSQNANSTGTTAISVMGSVTGVGNTSGESLSGHVVLDNPSSASLLKNIHAECSFYNAEQVLVVTAGVHPTTTAAVDAVKFFMNTGNITSGEIRMYGIKDA